jgi:hypothetical protein
MTSAAIETPIPATAEPELGEWRRPNGHDSAIPPKCPALMFVSCGHYAIKTTWNEFCISCGVRHEPFRIYWDSFRNAGTEQIPKNYCGFCGAKMVNLRAAR